MKNRFKFIVLIMSVVCLLICSVGMPQAVFAEGENEPDAIIENEPLPLDAPQGVNVNLLNGSMAVLSWTGNAPQYEIYIRVEGESYRLLDTLTGTTSRLIKKLSTAKRYYVKVRALRTIEDKTFHSSYSKEVSFAPITAVKVSANAGDASSKAATVKWSKVTNADGYYVLRASSKDGKYGKIATATGTSYKDTKAKLNVKYYYKVCAYKKIGDKTFKSQYSDAVAAYKRLAAPASVKLAPGYKRITLSWKKVSGASYYQIYRATSKDGKYTHLKNSSSDWAADETVSTGKKYYYKVRAVYKKDGALYLGVFSSIKSASGVKIDKNKPVIALSFDDGPGTTSTKRILDVLEKYGCRATFFTVGTMVRDGLATENLIRERNMGCEIGNHSYNHPAMTSLTDSEIKAQFKKADSIIKKATGVTPKLARLPYGSNNSRVLAAMEKPCIQWDIDTEDWKSHNPDMIYSRVVGKVKDGQFLLFHDIHSTTADAVERIIPKLVSQGYQIVTVSELAEYRGVELKAGKLYYNLKK